MKFTYPAHVEQLKCSKTIGDVMRKQQEETYQVFVSNTRDSCTSRSQQGFKVYVPDQGRRSSRGVLVIYVKVCRADEGAMEGMTGPGCTQ
jgi:hypothetical protein